ncbi:hypothetical protein GCM10023156_37790 [Novipirellula rosea]|uniref:Uncharacterized protein n=1 Tax=Novipirellula rosea TaxID=1031540 RepID=A0ABP8N2Q4_9BACT
MPFYPAKDKAGKKTKLVTDTATTTADEPAKATKSAPQGAGHGCPLLWTLDSFQGGCTSTPRRQ